MGSLAGLRRIVILAVTLWILLCGPRTARADEIRTTVDNLHPTQSSIGVAAARDKMRTWREAATRANMSLSDYFTNVVQAEVLERPLQGVIDPAGRIRVTDGHHRVYALRQLAQEMGHPVELRIPILQDYRGWSFKDYAEDFVTERKLGRFSDNVKDRSAVEKMRSLPDEFEGMQNDPMRSLIGAVFRRAKLSGSAFDDYVQFEVGRMLADRGLLRRLKLRGLVPLYARTFPDGKETDARVIDAVYEIVLSDREVVGFLDASVRNDAPHAAATRKQLKLATEQVTARRPLLSVLRSGKRSPSQTPPPPRSSSSRVAGFLPLGRR